MLILQDGLVGALVLLLGLLQAEDDVAAAAVGPGLGAGLGGEVAGALDDAQNDDVASANRAKDELSHMH